MDEDWIEAVLLKAEKERSVMKVLDVKFEQFVPKGDNNLSQILRATLTVLLGSGRRKKMKAIIKKELKNKREDAFKESSLFKRETKMYLNVLRPMEVLMDEFEDKRDKMWPKMFGCDAYHVIVLEDLSEENFVVADRRSCLDLSHGLLVVRSLARFHAMSKILMERGLVHKDDFKNYFFATDSRVTKGYEGCFKEFSLAIQSSWPAEWKYLAEKIEAQAECVCEKLKSLVEDTDDKFLVVNQGDIWTCNLLFKYSEQDNQPIAVKFVDFQASHINSYVWDLVLFVYSSIIPSVRRREMGNIVRCYHEVLVSSLEYYGFTGIAPSLEEVNSEFERTLYFALTSSTIEHAIMIAEAKDDCDCGENGEECNHVMSNPELFKSQRIIEDVLPDLLNFIELGLL